MVLIYLTETVRHFLRFGTQIASKVPVCLNGLYTERKDEAQKQFTQAAQLDLSNADKAELARLIKA